MNLRELFLYKNFGPQGSGGGSGSGVTIKNQNKTFTENGTYKADSGYTGLGTVTVNVPETEPVLETLAVTENGEYTPGSDVDGFSKVTVDVETGSGGYSIEDVAQADKISGDLIIDGVALRPYAFAFLTNIGKVTLKQGIIAPNTNTSNCFGDSSVTEVDGDFAMKGHNRVYQGMFTGCKSLKKVKCPNWQPYNTSFSNCEALESVDVFSIGYDNAYSNCKNLNTIVLRNGICQDLNSGPSYWAFPLNNTPFDPDYASATGGFVLVPSALISEYQAATNWATLYEAGLCTFLPLEEYTVDGTTTGEIDWDKLNAVVYSE